MIRDTIICNLCFIQIQYHPAYGADCLCLNQKGPCGAEGTVLVTDDYRSFPEHSQVHICRQCEKGLRAFFTADDK